ncbi:MAG: bifunctional phosphoribosylaminoimidazolecarboxamide formyltransferase/IMP cyclohydrolase [Thermoleophilia bacterium]|nr:bifunctional phosphoribosylaminoimidazolecarboxamide formyltransferase/IMP cyclohydrolase [Thermoleophilia bacterium]
MKVKRALISVTNKIGLDTFAQELSGLGVQIISTGGTARFLEDSGVDVVSVSDVTGFPEIMNGRVKTLHPNIHAGLLADRDNHDHMLTLKEHGIKPIDMVVVNLYPFEDVSSRRGVSEKEVIENIDIGGPTIIRAASKNFKGVAVVTDPRRYSEIVAEMKKNDNQLSLGTLRSLATQAFHNTAHYDFVIANWFNEGMADFPPFVLLDFEKVLDLRYGENPHQRAAYYSEVNARRHLLSRVTQLHGAELSFNSLLDLNAARELLSEFTLPAAAIIKHNNPCGAAVAEDITKAYRKAHATDPISAFGSVVALNRIIDADLAETLAKKFIEVLIAPGYEAEALEILSQKPRVRLLVDEERRKAASGERDLKRVTGGVLVQDKDSGIDERENMKVVTKRHPTEHEWGDALFAWRVVKHVRSNAIVLANDLATMGIGAGQMSRIDSMNIALDKSAGDLMGAAVGSDAFFPFTDALDLAIAKGISVVVQPGGSNRDDEVIKLCDEHDVAMIFTKVRHFFH